MISVRARKSLGQHFLADKSILKRIAEAARLQVGDEVIEIGPGTGLLTTELLKTPLQHLTAFEVDDRVVPELAAQFAAEGERFKVIEEDILKTDLQRMAEVAGQKLRVVGNIPYYITSPILFHLIDARSSVQDALMLVQLEVAERLAAKPRTKAYGIPTVLANFFGEVEFLFKVRSGAFRPPPKVDSAVVRIDFTRPFFVRTGIAPPEGFNERSFQSFIRGLFRMRRKTIRNNLKGLIEEPTLLRLTESEEEILGRRAEELGIEELIGLFQLTRG